MGVENSINLFYGTPLTLDLNVVLGCVWLVGFIVLLVPKLRERYRLTVRCRGNIPEDDENVLRIFEDICDELGIAGKVCLCRNDLMNVACFTYHHGPVVILPFEKYTDKELEIIFCHELCHYLNKDIYLKTVGCIAALLHVFNPAVHILMKDMGMLCEIYCDRAASKKGANRFTTQEYFQTLLNLRVDSDTRDRYQLLAMADSKSDSERRTEYMKHYLESGGMKKGIAVALAACFLLGSSITSLAAGDGVAEAYGKLTEYTSDENTYAKFMDITDVTDEEAVQILCAEYDLDPDKVVMTDDGMDLMSNSGLVQITWTVPKDTTYMSIGFKQEIGDELAVFVYGTPDDITYKMGIKDPKAKMWYVEGSNVVEMRYYVEIKGRHYFYVTNPSEEEELHIDAYILRIPKDEVAVTE